MELQRSALTVAKAGVLAGLLTITASPGPANAVGPTGTANSAHSWSAKAAAQPKTANAATVTVAACETSVTWPTAAATVEAADVTAERPSKADPYDSFKFVGTRANATWYAAINATGTQFYYYGPLLHGGTLYRHTTYVPDTGLPKPTFKKVGTGWTSFKSIATSNTASPRHGTPTCTGSTPTAACTATRSSAPASGPLQRS